MKKLLLVIMLGVSALTVSAQKTLSLVMKYTWTMDTKTYKVISEGRCSDGIEFDFPAKKAVYYTPDANISETLCKITKVSTPVVNDDNSTTYEYILYMVGPEKEVNCSLNVSKDLKEIRLSMISDGKAKVYSVSNMIPDDDN